jgi:hypothetical protein
MQHNKKHSAKKSLLKKIVGKVNPKGASPTKLDNGLGSSPLPKGDGGGSNLGLSGVY